MTVLRVEGILEDRICAPDRRATPPSAVACVKRGGDNLKRPPTGSSTAVGVDVRAMRDDSTHGGVTYFGVSFFGLVSLIIGWFDSKPLAGAAPNSFSH